MCHCPLFESTDCLAGAGCIGRNDSGEHSHPEDWFSDSFFFFFFFYCQIYILSDR